MNWFIFGCTLSVFAFVAIFIWTGSFLEEWVKARWGSRAALWVVWIWAGLLVATWLGVIASD